MSTYRYEHYLAAKKTVDDRALCRAVCDEVRSFLTAVPGRPVRVLEVGGGIGTMVARLLDWQMLDVAEYVIVDESAELLAHARHWLSAWATTRGATVDATPDGIAIRRENTNVRVRLLHADVHAYLTANDSFKADLLIANAFLDLVDVRATLPSLLGTLKAGGMYWLTINYDGETIFLPEHRLDGEFMQVYNRSMDERVRAGRSAGDSKAGRHLFEHLRAVGAPPSVAGASDWVVHAVGGTYPADEANFLRHIVSTVDEELQRHPQVAPADRQLWSRTRQEQIDRGELVYVAHQLDFAGRLREHVPAGARPLLSPVE